MHIPNRFRRASFGTISALLLLQSCAPLVTETVAIPAPPAMVRSALAATAANLGLQARKGPLDAWVCANRGFVSSCKTMPAADLFMERPNSSSINPTGIIGAAKLGKFENNQTDVEIAIAGAGGADPQANLLLFQGALGQQVQLDMGKRKPAVNPSKTRMDYVLRDLVSPAWATAYLADRNPLITRGNATAIVGTLAALDALDLGLVVSGLVATDPKDRNGAIGVGLACALVWRAIALKQLTDVDDYNRLAASPYDLVQFKF